MRKILLFTFFALLFSLGGRAETIATPLAYLNAMTQAQRDASYEQIYIFQEGKSIESWLYRHAQWQNEQYAQLMGLDGTRVEFLQQGNIVGYFGDFQPFSLQTNRILDNRPMVLFADFNHLDGYTLVDVGRERIANRVTKVFRILPNDNFRYQYRVWIDEESKLLLKSELLDQEQNVLERFLVVHFREDEALVNIAEIIRSLFLPPLIPSTAPMNSESLNWQPQWLPKGFTLQSLGTELLPDGEQVESQLYSDGLFSFTLYLNNGKNKGLPEYSWQEGKTTIYTRRVADKEVVIIGEIPLATAHRILQEISIK